MPAYTDRVLVKGESITVLGYERCEADFSDHKPVVLVAKVKVSHDVIRSNSRLSSKRMKRSTRSSIAESLKEAGLSQDDLIDIGGMEDILFLSIY